jgi:DNA recombination protein RmuC
MSSLIEFFLTNREGIIYLIVGFLIGAALFSSISYWLTKRRMAMWDREYGAIQAQLQNTREQYANLKGQYGQMQYQLKDQTQLLKDARSQLGQEFENLANRIFENKQKQFDFQNQKTLNHSLNPLKQQIDEFKKQVSDVYQKESAERNQLIGKIGELQSQTQKIGEDALNLAMALKGSNKTQGNWGEVVLERLLEESGLQKGREYDTQVAMGDGEGKRRNPDVIIYLPENKQLVIDSKVSLIDYERYINAEVDAEREKALQAHVQSVRAHIKQLSKKNYESLAGLQSLDFVFLFMPIEAAFMLALQQEPALFREAYDQQIVLVSPTTLLATLRTVSNIWRYHKQHKYSEKIAQQAGGLYDQFVLVIESLDDLGNQLSRTQNSYDTARRRLTEGKGNLIKRIEGLRELGAKTKRQLPVEKLLDEELTQESLLDEMLTEDESSFPAPTKPEATIQDQQRGLQEEIPAQGSVTEEELYDDNSPLYAETVEEDPMSFEAAPTFMPEDKLANSQFVETGTSDTTSTADSTKETLVDSEQ